VITGGDGTGVMVGDGAVGGQTGVCGIATDGQAVVVGSTPESERGEQQTATISMNTEMNKSALFMVIQSRLLHASI
jgi:hypothetical protein